MTQDMVERVARAISRSCWLGGNREDDWECWKTEAIAAITAVRESIVREMMDRTKRKARENAYDAYVELMLKNYAREHNINLDSTQG